MRTGKRMIAALCWTLALLCLAATAAQAKETVRPHKIQLAILLDTSGSMSGLIEQAKTQLWTIVNEFATTKKDGRIPDFEVALYEYGKSSIPASEGYLRMILPLTTDLDKVSEELFALRTNGGEEYCGKVIQSATGALAWSASDEDLKVIFIAGNEPFTQGDVNFRKACPAAVARGIVVNTIFCGPYDKGVSTHWKDGALLADGKYMNINHNARAVHIDSPQDKEIARLGAELNATYVAYGSAGKICGDRQAEQDRNALSTSFHSAVQRVISKSSAQYRNAGWDLVDAVREGNLKIEEVKAEALPENMRKMTVAERKAYVETRARERKEIQDRIKKLNSERRKHVAAERKNLAESGENTLDAAIIKVVRAQAVKKNFTFSE